jgi:hypothetical protein
MSSGESFPHPSGGEAPDGRRPYAPPTVERVELRPEEAVLGACKNQTAGAGPRQPSSCRAVSACASIGS